MKSQPLRSHKSYLAFIGHRISGLALALFLPLHFLLLGTAIEGDAALQQALALTENPLAKFAEWGLVILLVAHLLFGLRVLALEMTSWPTRRDSRTAWVLPAMGLAMVAGLVFLLRA